MNYPTSNGFIACCAALPERTAGAIYQRAAQLGVRVDGRDNPRHTWPPSDEIDAKIRAVYEQLPKGREPVVARLAEELQRPRWWISHRARDLGLVPPRFKEPPWKPLEVDILKMARGLTPAATQRRLKQRGFARSETAIIVKRKRLGISTDDPYSYSARGLALALGVDSSTVCGWIEGRLIIASPRGTRRTRVQGGDIWKITRRDARHFIKEHVERIDFRKVDKHWLVDLLTDPLAG